MRVLLCDDHTLFAELLGDVLAARGDRVVITSRPTEAVAAAVRSQPDVCVMDRVFPEGDAGVAAAREVLRVSPDTKIMMLTGDADAASAHAALGAGVRALLTKDEPLDQIVEALDAVASGLLVVDPSVLRPDVRVSRSALLQSLTLRESEVLERLVNGQSGQAMAAVMEVSYSTMRTHVQNILVKLGVHSQLEAVAYAVQHDLVQSRIQ